MMVANIEGLARFMKRNRRNCEIFYARCKNTLGSQLRLFLFVAVRRVLLTSSVLKILKIGYQFICEREKRAERFT